MATALVQHHAVFISHCEPHLLEKLLNLNEFKVKDFDEQLLGERHDSVSEIEAGMHHDLGLHGGDDCIRDACKTDRR